MPTNDLHDACYSKDWGRAGAVVVEESLFDVASGQLPATAYLIVEDAQAAFLDVLALLHPPPARADIGVSERACVA